MYPRCSCANTQHQTRKLEYVLARAMKKKNILYNYHSLKMEFLILFQKHSSLYLTFYVLGKKRGISTFLAGQISCFPTLTLQGIFLSSEATDFF